MSRLFFAGKVFLLGVIILLAACQRGITKSPRAYQGGGDDPVSLSGMEKSILGYVNAYRSQQGKPELKMIGVAVTEAARHSANMASGKTAFGHNGFEGRVSRISKQIGGVAAAAENVAFGEMTAKEVVDGWLHSPGHKKNIEGNYTLTGIGVSKDKNGQVYYTQIFLKQ